jgi:hypothetical protein
MHGELESTGGKWLWPTPIYYPGICLEVLGRMMKAQESLWYLIDLLVTSRLIKFIILRDLIAFMKNTPDQNLQVWYAGLW